VINRGDRQQSRESGAESRIEIRHEEPPPWNFRSPERRRFQHPRRERSSQELVPYKANGETFKNTRGAPLALRYRAAAGDLAAATLPWRGERGGFRAGENKSPSLPLCLSLSFSLSSIIKDKSAAGRARTRREMDLSSV